MSYKFVDLNENFLKYKIAHRGLHSKTICENSMDSFRLAKENEYAIELDIHRLASGEFVVFHDANLKRVTGTDKLIETLTSSELSSIKLWDNQSIPMLDEVLKEIDGAVPILIELKPENGFQKKDIKPLLEILKNYNHIDKIAIQTFNPLIIRQIKKQTTDYSVGLLSSYNLGKMSKIKNYIAKSMLLFGYSKADFVSYDINFLPNKYVTKIRKKRKKVLSWVVNTEEKLKKAQKFADNIIFENLNF